MQFELLFFLLFFSLDCTANILMVILISIFSESTNWFVELNEILFVSAHEMRKLMEFDWNNNFIVPYHRFELIENLFMFTYKITMDFNGIVLICVSNVVEFELEFIYWASKDRLKWFASIAAKRAPLNNFYARQNRLPNFRPFNLKMYIQTRKYVHAICLFTWLQYLYRSNTHVKWN